LHIAIDFTLSNGKPDHELSLHHFDANGRNQYADAILSVGSILQYYDTDKLIPVYGFGGKVPGMMTGCHCFALNGNCFSPEVIGTQQVI